VIIAVDFDGTVVKQEHAYDDLATPLEFMDGAREALYSLKRAGHLLLLWSARASRALLYDPNLNPLVRAGAVPSDRKRWLESKALNWARYHQMVEFVNRELPGVFDAIDDGLAGKPQADLFIDDRALVVRGVATWARIQRQYGEAVAIFDDGPIAELLDRRVESLQLVPTGTLAGILETIHGELRAAGIVHYQPSYQMGQAGFWAADRGTVVNLPWFLATDELRDLAYARYPWTWENVTRSIRHEVGHSVGYAFEAWRRADWTEQFGDFTLPYPTRQPDAPIDPESTDFVNYMTDVEPGYAQRHPDEAWAESFACWLDPASNWRQRYAVGTGARAKLDYIDRLSKESLAATPTNFDLGVPRERRESYSGQTVRQALGIAEDDRKIDLSSQ